MAKAYYEIYYTENTPEDEKTVYNICSSAAKRIEDLFMVKFSKDNMPEVGAHIVGTIFGKTFECILDELQKLQETHSDYYIELYRRLRIGYDTQEDDMDEKEGNFMIYMKDLGCTEIPKKPEITDDMSSKKLVTSWLTNRKDQVTKDIEVINRIGTATHAKLRTDVGLILSTPEYIWPIFITIYDQIREVLLDDFNADNDDDLEINFISCFNIGVRLNKDGLPTIYIRPNINAKLALKNDGKASSDL